MNRITNSGKNWKPGEMGGGQITSYANASKMTGNDRLNINVINVRIKRDHQQNDALFDDSVCQRVCDLIRINPKTDTKGSQYLYDKGGLTTAIWLRDNVTVRSSDESIKVAPGFEIESVHPAGMKQVPLMIIGLEQDVPDPVILDYIKLFGLKPIDAGTERLFHKDGIWKGQANGDRRIKVDVSEQISPMGTYHSIRGRRVQIVYPGNPKTCGNCHKTPTYCPGKGIAKKCRNNGGSAVHLNDHMKSLHNDLENLRNKAYTDNDADDGEVDSDADKPDEPKEDLIDLTPQDSNESPVNSEETNGKESTENGTDFPPLLQ